MEICSVEFVYKCQVCGGLTFQGPYYYTSDSNIFDHLQFAIEQMVTHNKENIFEFSGTREGFFLDSCMVPKISFHKLLQFPGYDEILKYSWHNCDIGSNNSIYENVSGIAVLSGFKFEYVSPNNPTNNVFLRRLVDFSKECETKEDLFEILVDEYYKNNPKSL